MNLELTESYISALTGNPESVMDWRVIHDTDKGEQGRNMRGTLKEVKDQLIAYNQQGWGVFACINQMDGQGQTLQNVNAIRAHVVDLDDPEKSDISYNKATTTTLQPHFAVQTSPKKYHIYWLVQPYSGNDFYSTQQRKIAQLFEGDKSIVDATRVLRVPGFYHMKNPQQPFIVSCWGLGNHQRWNFSQVEQAFAHVNVFESMHKRFALGDETLQAPSLEWLEFAMGLINPNEIGRDEWVSFTAAVKQSGWLHATEDYLFHMWQKWCEQYEDNNIEENTKLWKSISDSEVGWKSLERRTSIKAYMMNYSTPSDIPQEILDVKPIEQVIDQPEEDEQEKKYKELEKSFHDILGRNEMSVWFRNCFSVEQEGKILVPSGRLLNQTQFNMRYGGKLFLMNEDGKTTDIPWKAATSSPVYMIPKVDHVRFAPTEEKFSIITDEFDRKGVNTYMKPNIEGKPGDISKFMYMIECILPVESDRKIFLDYLAHNVKYPGYKILWAPVIVSTQGVGKGIIASFMEYALGKNYVHRPDAQQFLESGGKFNAWMENRLLIVCDEINSTDRFDLVENLKKVIADERIQIEGKGDNQKMADNTANWIFYSNYKTCIPLERKERRYCIFYSQLESEEDVMRFGLNDEFFKDLTDQMKHGDMNKYIYHYFINYPIECGSLPGRGPKPSNYEEVINLSKSPVQLFIEDAIEDNIAGFKNGYVSLTQLTILLNSSKISKPSKAVLAEILKKMGYRELGKTPEAVNQERMGRPSVIFGRLPECTTEGYSAAQGYSS